MKRANNLYEQISAPGNLYHASWKAAKGKRGSKGVLSFQRNLEAEIVTLREQLLAGKVEVGDYHYFKIFEPKERDICAAPFREQVLHHALMNICDPFLEKRQIFDSYACRKGKGVHAALKRAEYFTRRNEWYLKLDVRKFFASLDHQVINRQISQVFKEQKLLGVFGQIVDSYGQATGKGVPIGNLTSQYFANNYLCELDHFIKEELKIKAYVRYMDDMVCWGNDKRQLLFIARNIGNYLNTRLEVDLKPIQLNQTVLGLPFLGYRIDPFRIRLLSSSRSRYFRKIEVALEKNDEGYWTQEQASHKVLPLIAFTRHAEADMMRQLLFLRSAGQKP